MASSWRTTPPGISAAKRPGRSSRSWIRPWAGRGAASTPGSATATCWFGPRAGGKPGARIRPMTGAAGRRGTWPILQDYEVNRRRRAAGKKPATSIWLWGQGRPPQLPTLKERFGLSGAVISAVDLIRGIGKYAGLTPILVPGATGFLDTNYAARWPRPWKP